MTSSNSAKTRVDIVIPAYNEENILKKNILKLKKFIEKKSLPEYEVRIKIADNASTDKTAQLSKELATRYKNVDYVHLHQKGRGRALRKCWMKSNAKILSYMDADLSADLSFIKPLLNAIHKEGVDIAIGSRLAKGAEISGRTFTRELMSRGYNLLIKILFLTDFKDAQCGFKAISKSTFLKLEPLVKNQNWFFDSELLINAHKSRFKIKEIPISWKDDPSSTVKVAATALEDLKGLLRLKRERPWENISKS